MATGKITKAQREKKERDDETAASIRATLNDYYPGRWAAEVNYGPVCSCTLRITSDPCPVHPWSHIFVKAGFG